MGGNGPRYPVLTVERTREFIVRMPKPIYILKLKHIVPVGSSAVSSISTYTSVKVVPAHEFFNMSTDKILDTLRLRHFNTSIDTEYQEDVFTALQTAHDADISTRGPTDGYPPAGKILQAGMLRKGCYVELRVASGSPRLTVQVPRCAIAVLAAAGTA
jgi:hypothetical protein